MRNFDIHKTTTNSRVQRMINRVYISGCPMCAPNKGCNSISRRNPNNNWKQYRKKQWRYK